MLIAIDHGNKQVKTVHGNAIVSGVQKSKTRPYGRDILKYGGSYYTLSAQRIPYQKDKTTDERFFILSLFCHCGGNRSAGRVYLRADAH